MAASLLAVCLSSYDYEKEHQAFLKELSDVESEFLSTVREITNSDDAKSANKSADEALVEFENLFSASPLGSLRKVQKDSGMTPVDRTEDDVVESLADRGYIIANNRLFFCATSRGSGMKTVKQVTDVNSSQGVRDGEFSIDQLKAVLPGYEEPDYREVLSNLSPKSNSSSYVISSASGASPEGNLSRLRELLRSCGGDLKRLRKILESSSHSTSILYSKIKLVSLTKPLDLEISAFDVNYARKALKYPLFPDDVFVGDENPDTMLCVLEEPSSINESYDVVRVVRADSSEFVRNQAPIFITRGFNGSLLGRSAHLLGLVVNGVARVVDITSDFGIKSYADTYTSADVAASIKSVFPDLVDAGAVGDELYITTLGSGMYSSLEFFPLGDGYADAFTAVGVSATLKTHYGISTDKSVLVSGGEKPKTPTTVQHVLNTKTLTSKAQREAVLFDKSRYWVTVEPEVQDALSKVEQLATRDIRSGNTYDLQSVIKANGLTRFTYIDQCNTYELIDVLESLGSDAERVLCRAFNVFEIDPYINHDYVYSALTRDFEALQAQNGFSNNVGKTGTTSPRDLNRTQLNTALLLGFATNESVDTGDTDNAIQYNERFKQSMLVGITSSSVTEVQSSDLSVRAFDSLLSDFIYAVELFRPVLNLDGRQVAREVASYLKREYPNEYDSLVKASDFIAQKTNELVDYVGDLYEDSVIKEAVTATSNANDSAVSYLRRADALLASVENAMRGYASTYQSTYDKIMSLSNIGVNIFSNQSFQTKYLSCYVGASASLLLGKVLEKYLAKINEMADKLNRILQKIANALRKYFDKINCVVQNMNLSMSGYASYSVTKTGFMGVQLNMNCVMSAGIGLDPQIATNVASILGRVLSILNMFQLQLVTFEEQDKNTQGVVAQAQADLFNTIRDAIDRLKACLG